MKERINMGYELGLARRTGTKAGYDRWAKFDARRCGATNKWNEELLAEVKVRPIGGYEKSEILRTACAFGILTALFELGPYGGNAVWIREELCASTFRGMTRLEARVLHLEWARRIGAKKGK